MKRKFAFEHAFTYGFVVLFGKMFWLPEVISVWPVRVAKLIRGLFPYFLVRGARDCDSGGHVHHWYFVVAWNDWHWNKLMAQDIGDGPDAWQVISIKSWVRGRFGRGES